MVFSLVYIFYCWIKSFSPYEWICEKLCVLSSSTKNGCTLCSQGYHRTEAFVSPRAEDDAETGTCAVMTPSFTLRPFHSECVLPLSFKHSFKSAIYANVWISFLLSEDRHNKTEWIWPNATLIKWCYHNWHLYCIRHYIQSVNVINIIRGK